jgi:hypothetical protein
MMWWIIRINISLGKLFKNLCLGKNQNKVKLKLKGTFEDKGQFWSCDLFYNNVLVKVKFKIKVSNMNPLI